MALKFPGSESKSEKTKKIKGLKKDQLVILLLFGILLVVIAIPTSPGEVSSENTAEEDGTQTETAAAGEDGTTGQTYEQRQEQLDILIPAWPLLRKYKRNRKIQKLFL